MGTIIFHSKKTQKQLLATTSAAKKVQTEAVNLTAALSAPAIVNDLVPNLIIERVGVGDLKPAKRKVRRASKQHITKLAKSLKTVGQVAPILLDAEDRIVDGHAVAQAMKEAGATHINVVRLTHLNDEQLALVRIALNKLSDGSEWDLTELRFEFERLDLCGYDLEVTGFSMPEIDIILKDPETDQAADEPCNGLVAPSQPVSRLGDLWLLSEHKLLCGDALDAASYAAVLLKQKADACFTDCPWNIPIEGFVSGLGSAKHKDFKMAAGEMSDDAFQGFCDAFTHHVAKALQDGGVLFSCIDWRSYHRLVEAGRKAGLRLINAAVWHKGSGGMGGLYRSCHELIPIFCKGKSPKTNNIQLGKHGRDRTNVWSYAGANKPGSSAGEALKHHPTPKPIEMVADALLDVTRKGELVLDPFMGSGTTLLAAERTRRVAAGIELDPAYVDVCIQRWQEMTGKEALHAASGLTFLQLAAERAGQPATSKGETNDDD